MRLTLIVACVTVLALSASLASASPHYGYGYGGYGHGWQQQIQKPCVYSKHKPYGQYRPQQQYSYGGYGGYGGYGYDRSSSYYPRQRHHDPWSSWRQSHRRGGRYW